MADAQLKLSRAPLPAELASSQWACPEPAPSLVEGLSRRALLAAACAAPALPLAASPSVRFERSREAAPSAAEALRPAWTRALARFRAAEADVRRWEGHPDEDSFDRAMDAFNRALRRLLRTPSPGLPALATKLEIAVAAELADLAYAPPALAALARDARRLASRSS